MRFRCILLRATDNQRFVCYKSILNWYLLVKNLYIKSDSLERNNEFKSE